MFKKITGNDEKYNLLDYEMCFVSDNSKLLNKLDLLIKKQGSNIATKNYNLLRNMIVEGKHDDFAKETINHLINADISYSLSSLPSEHKISPSDIFYYYVEKSEMFKNLKNNSNFNNPEIYEIIFWFHDKKGLIKVNKDLSDKSINDLSNYRYSKVKHIAKLHIKDVFKFWWVSSTVISIFIVGLVGFSYLYEYTKGSFYEEFMPEIIELAKTKESNFINSFGEHKNDPKNFYNSYSANVHNIIYDYAKFEPIVLYKKNNTTNENKEFISKLDNHLLEKGENLDKNDIDSYLLQANNYEILLNIKNKNITYETTNVFKYTERAIIQDLIITNDELNLFRDIR
jgi:hypothetical protein